MTISFPAATASAPSTTISISPQSVTTAPSNPHSSRRIRVHRSLLPPAKTPFILLKDVIMQAICASLTSISKGFRYSSLAERSVSIESTASTFFPAFPRRNVSCSFAAKCFGHTITGRPFCTPFVISQAQTPVRYGSSEKYSKFLPHSGFLWRFTAGASQTFTC